MLDRTKPYGTIAGDLFIPDGCDRPAKYEQNGKFYDAHGREVEPGKPLNIVPTDDETDDVMSVAELLERAETMHWRTFKANAMRVLGPDCPNTKATIVDALKAAQQVFEERAQKRNAERTASQSAAAAGVDLAAWGRGTKEYLWGDIRKAIKAAHGRNVTERDDAVEFLIEAGVITAAEARQDVARSV